MRALERLGKEGLDELQRIAEILEQFDGVQQTILIELLMARHANRTHKRAEFTLQHMHKHALQLLGWVRD